MTADDLGFTPSVTAGILEAHHAGSVTATSMMVHQPGWDDAVRTARAAPTLDVGLHFNVLVGAPMTKATSLTDTRTGTFLPLRSLVMRALAGRIDAAEVEAECTAQFAALVAAGIHPTHMDSHRHTHALPVFRGAVSRVAVAHGVWQRRPLESPALFAVDAAAQLHRAVIRAAWTVSGAGAREVRHTDHFAGIALQGGTHFDARLDVLLEHLRPGVTELMVHPGRVDDALRALDGYTWQRERELAALTSRPLRDRLARGATSITNPVTLIGFRALTA
ncbi:MAG: ChbG/HpnK family deacetylase [Gemmatimonadetes bacterium]|nr:ChbG/HpnK family deacetylase [Gemmatimonadota bacterium]